MPRRCKKRKQVEEDSADETSWASSNKAPRKEYVLSGTVSFYPAIEAMLQNSLRLLGTP